MLSKAFLAEVLPEPLHRQESTVCLFLKRADGLHAQWGCWAEVKAAFSASAQRACPDRTAPFGLTLNFLS